ncbi:Cadherin-24 [Liparis tanakae]|uniref:Cadherin-24 n=1 Tax=Liparis tanakae TaxID=230148 RepID=A0A4Z2ETK4_9TELE|nr:Cadherin-24 [Liparis tanakae]
MAMCMMAQRCMDQKDFRNSPHDQKMMARLPLWTSGLLMAVVSVSLSAAGGSGPAGPAREGSPPVLIRQKRDWIWNSLYVEEEKPAPVPYKIGQLKSSQRVEVKSFKIEGEGANTIFTVDPKGDLFVTRSLDREEKNAYRLTAKMYDGNNKLIEDSGEFLVHVTDINDNRPVFPGAYNGSIPERSLAGTMVVEVKATDADDPSTANGELRYSLVPSGDASTFGIDSITGVISCRTDSLDREARSRYVLLVQAQDMRGMASGSSSTTSVTVTVDDANDNIASFTRKTYALQVPEDQRLNERIGTLELEDGDLLQNKEPIFLLPKENAKVFGVELSRPNKDGNLLLRQVRTPHLSLVTCSQGLLDSPIFIYTVGGGKYLVSHQLCKFSHLKR